MTGDTPDGGRGPGPGDVNSSGRDPADALRGRVDFYVRAGFYAPAEIEKLLGEELEGDGDDTDDGDGEDGSPSAADRLPGLIDAALAAQARDEQTWPATTDGDRLDAAFADLAGRDLVAMQNVGYTQSDGLADVAEVYDAAGGPGSAVVGYCFYHGQDLERAVAGGDLFLAFGAFGRDDGRAVQVGHAVRAALESAGLAVQWDGSTATRLKVVGLRWRRRQARDR